MPNPRFPAAPQRPAPSHAQKRGPIETANQRVLAALNHAQKAMPANLIVRPGGSNGDDRVLFSKTLSAFAGMTDFLSFGAELVGLVDESG